MTVSSNTARVSFAGDDDTTSFDLGAGFIFFNDSELVVEVVTDSTGAISTLTLNVNYTVSGGGGATGTVDTSSGSSPHGVLVSGTTLVIRRVLPITQTDDYVNGEISDAEVTEDRFDRLTMIAQQLDEKTGRTLRASVVETAIDDLPTPAARRNKFLKFDDTVDASPEAIGVTELPSGLVLDEDDFSSDSPDNAPSQKSTAQYIADRVLDEDDFASNSATRPPSQQSTKGYVTGKQVVWVPATAMKPTVSNGCANLAETETTAGRPDMYTLNFDNAADEHAQFQIAFPAAWDEGTVTFKALWTTTNTGTDGVAWALQGVAVADNDTIDVAYGTAKVVTDDNQGAAENLLVTSESSAITIAGTPGAGEMCFFRIFRDVSDANDDMTQDARLLGVQLFFTTDAPTED